MFKRFKLRFEFLVPALTLLCVHLPYWQSSVWPEHYTMVTFMNFYSFYNEFFFHHDLVRWMPFGSYGIQANFWQLHQLTPISYGMILLGKVFQVRDVLIIFKIGVFFEQLTFLIGTQLLSGKLYKKKITIIFVGMLSALSVVWTYEIFWNLRIFYLLPLVFYFLIRFADTRDATYFWAWALILTASIIGNLPYFAPLNFLISILFSIILLIGKKFDIYSILPRSKSGFALFGFFILSFSTLAYFTVNCFNEIVVFKPGRDQSAFFATSLDHFLVHSKASFSQYFEMVFPSFGRGHDNTKYFGFLPFLLSCFAMMRIRERRFSAFVFVSGFLIFFSVGDQTPLAKIVYYIYPPIRIFRYLGQVGALIKFLWIVIAGFGFDYLLRTKKSQRLFLFFGILIGIFFLVAQSARWYERLFVSDWPYFVVINSAAVTLVLITLRFFKSQRILGFTILIVSCLDLLAFQSLVFQKVKQSQFELPKEFRMVSDYSFQPSRIIHPVEGMDGRVQKATLFIDSIKGLWVEGYDFAKFDPCIPFRPAIFQSRSVFNLVDAIFKAQIPLGDYLINYEGFARHEKLPAFLKAIGCSTPKLKFSDRPVLALNDEEAQAKLLTSKNFDSQFVIEDVSRNREFSLTQMLTGKEGHLSRIDHIRHFSANQLRLDATIESSSGSWLYYADSYHPGWKAYVDGVQTTVNRANLAFKAIYLSKGRHRVDFLFFDGFNSVAAIMITCFGLLFCGYSAYLLRRVLLT